MRKIYFMALPENKYDFKKSRKLFTIGDTASQTLIQMYGGTFIVSLMLVLGISDANAGILSSFASMAAIIQLFSMGMVSRLKKHKLFVCITVFQKVSFSFLYFIPLLPCNSNIKIILFIAFFVYGHLMFQIGNPAIQDWIANLVPSVVRGRYFSIKDSIATFVVVTVMLVFGFIMDYFSDNNKMGFLIIGITIFILVIINFIAFSKMKEPKASDLDNDGKEMHGKYAKAHHKEQKMITQDNFLHEIKIAFSDKGFKIAFITNMLWITAFYFAAPFNASFQIKELNLSFTFIMSISFICSMFRVYIMPKVGKLGDKYGMAFVVKYSFLGIMFNYLFMAFSTPANAKVLCFLSSLSGAWGWSFIGVGMFGMQLQLLKENKRMIQLSILSSIAGVYGFFVSFIGGQLLKYLQNIKPTILGKEIYAQQILNIIGVFMIAILFIYVKKIQNTKIDNIS